MPISWPEVAEMIGVSMASQLQQQGLAVVDAVDALSLEHLLKFVEVTTPVLEGIATGDIHSDIASDMAAATIRHLGTKEIPTPLDDLRLKVAKMEEEMRDARTVIRELMFVAQPISIQRNPRAYERAKDFLLKGGFYGRL